MNGCLALNKLASLGAEVCLSVGEHFHYCWVGPRGPFLDLSTGLGGKSESIVGRTCRIR